MWRLHGRLVTGSFVCAGEPPENDPYGSSTACPCSFLYLSIYWVGKFKLETRHDPEGRLLHVGVFFGEKKWIILALVFFSAGSLGGKGEGAGTTTTQRARRATRESRES